MEAGNLGLKHVDWSTMVRVESVCWFGINAKIFVGCSISFLFSLSFFLSSFLLRSTTEHQKVRVLLAAGGHVEEGPSWRTQVFARWKDHRQRDNEGVKIIVTERSSSPRDHRHREIIVIETMKGTDAKYYVRVKRHGSTVLGSFDLGESEPTDEEVLDLLKEKAGV